MERVRLCAGGHTSQLGLTYAAPPFNLSLDFFFSTLNI